MTAIPVVEVYRGAGLFNHQSPQRLDVVRQEIDALLDGEHSIAELIAFAADAAHAPESRLLAGRTVIAAFSGPEWARRATPVDLDLVAGAITGLDGEHWRDEWRHCSLLDALGADRAARRDEPLPALADRERHR